ncbi:endonuclease [Escherichia phage alia]|uniref:CapR homology domain-containing protein n=1 Tax=Escherichia phage alia TaxID=2696379 RepID=A0A6B9X9M7_9CAUD|nr:endonuclease [Escherichia phage alia]QHR73816.1 hypothetical protein alia_102 [Escherichia phage alia]
MTAPKSWEQYKEELTPLAKNHNIQILGYVGEWKGSKTKLKLSCPDHGEWESTVITNFKTRGGKCCPDCNGHRKVTEEKECISLVDVAKERGFTFIGLAEEWRGVRTKIRIICPKHGEWNTTNIISFRNGHGCPTCASNKPLTWETELPILEEIAQKKGYQVLGYVGEWKRNKTKLDLLCHCGYKWDTTSINSFKRGSGCPLCGYKNTGKSQTISDDQHIADFFSTGVFPEGTIFTNTGARGKGCGHIIWMVECPVCSHDEYVQAGVCDGKFYSKGYNLKRGHMPCRCGNYHYTEDQITYKVRKEVESKGYIWVGWISKPSAKGKFKYWCNKHGEQIGNADSLIHRGAGCPQCAGHSQQQLYINIVKDNDIIVALKFGIAKDSDRRLNRQNNHNMFFMERICLYDFSTTKQCKAAERAIKKKLKTGILTARELKDGYTETVSVSDLENLQKIITQYGGKLVYSKEV